ncbi:MAG TPA: SRPBCC family protein [Myxococcales bacterium]|nr:SRPBCC family protein [Myxococcales bacterium]
MAFEIVKKFVVNAPPTAVWKFLIDPERVASCLPGAAITGKLDEKTYTGTMSMKVGPVSSSYKGKIVFDKLDEASMTAELSGIGQDVKGRGGADLKMKSEVKQNAAGETEVTATSQVNITGILAQMGRGMIQDVSDQMFQIFSQRLRAQLETAPAAPAPVAPAAAEPAASAPAPAAEAIAAAAPAAAPVAIQAAPVAPPVAAPAPLPPKPEVLDVGAIGARAAGAAARRTFSSPTFWLTVVVAAVALYLILR